MDIVFQSVQKTIEEKNDEGKITKVQIMDELALWCKTLSVASNKLGQLIFEMMEFTRNGLNAHNHMCKERADLWVSDTLAVVESVKKMLDSKSSESLRNNQNSQSTLIDKINKNSVEKIYTMKDTAKKSLWDSILGKEKDKMSDDD